MTDTLETEARPGRVSVWLLLLLPCVSASSSGCALAAVGAVGAGAVAYARGDVEKTYPYPIEVVTEATVAAMVDSGLQNVTHTQDQITASISGKTASGDDVKVVLMSQGPSTEMNLRVNVFGKKAISGAVLARVDSRVAQVNYGRVGQAQGSQVGPVYAGRVAQAHMARLPRQHVPPHYGIPSSGPGWTPSAAQQPNGAIR